MGLGGWGVWEYVGGVGAGHSHNNSNLTWASFSLVYYWGAQEVMAKMEELVREAVFLVEMAHSHLVHTASLILTYFQRNPVLTKHIMVSYCPVRMFWISNGHHAYQTLFHTYITHTTNPVAKNILPLF
jgi:hypothetical protein